MCLCCRVRAVPALAMSTWAPVLLLLMMTVCLVIYEQLDVFGTSP